MDKIDQAGLMAAAIGECVLCSNDSDEIYQVEFHADNGTNIIYNFRVCNSCMAEMRDIFSEWVPLFCTACQKGGWAKRDEPGFHVPGGAYAGFSDGCHNCSGVSEKTWWLSRDKGDLV